MIQMVAFVHLKHGGRLVYSLAWLETFILHCGVESSIRKQARFRIELARTG